MKDRVISVIIGLIALVSHGQMVYKGSIFNKENQPLSGVQIVSMHNVTNAVVSGIQGDFEIEILPNTKVIISHLGYKSIEIELTNDHNIIFLQEETQSLNEIVISASREQQRRREIPATVSIINQDLIKETKPIGIEQLVNQAPGVFMSTSSVSGNEQHMMAVRSPITTKALFLYLEDGIPIRPSAIFNHNALIETNQTAFDKIEILKGPSSSIYGSDAVGGSFNFVTKNPTSKFNSSLGFEVNDMGFKHYQLEIAKYISNDFGFYLGSHYAERNDGPIGHSDYEKFAITFKSVYHVNSSINWENVFDLIDYMSDTTGDLGAEDYQSKNFESDQTFTNREARSFRFRSSLNKTWSLNSKTSFNFLFRDNLLNQIPFYRIVQLRNQGQLTGAGTGEINSNKFNSVMGLIQHKIKFNANKASLILGGSIDYTKQEYIANKTNVDVDTQTGQNIAYTVNINDFILNYNAKIANYAAYLQYEISPTEKLKLTASVRFDEFQYNYDNLIESVAGVRDAKSTYNHIAPKMGVNYNPSNKLGLYANYSNGFTPPQAADLYRNGFTQVGGEIFSLKPSTYHNFEVGSYFRHNQKFQMAISLYVLKGENTLVSLRDENDVFYNTNIGSTRSVGVEYTFNYKFNPQLSISHNGSYAKHQYIDFFDQGIDYSHTRMVAAPNLLGQSVIRYSPEYFKGFSISFEHEMVGQYNTSFEGQVINTDATFSTKKYSGHNIFNLRVVFSNSKIEIWSHLLNVFDSLYATRVSYNQFRKENTYTIGNPQAFHLGLKYHF